MEKTFSVTDYKTIDVFKLLFSSVVIAIHTTVPSNWLVKALFEFPVPFFFITSGFFLGVKNSYARTFDWTKRILGIYVIWTLIYLPFAIYGFIEESVPFLKAVAIYVRNVLFVGENYLSWPLWYLLASVVGGLVIFSIQKMRVNVVIMLATAIICMVVKTYIDVCDPAWYERIFRTTRNGIFVGFPYMTFGFVLSQFRDKIEQYKTIVGTLAILSVGFIFLQNEACRSISMAGFFIFTLAVRFPVGSTCCVRIRKMSLLIYLIHMLFAGALVIIADVPKGMILFMLTLVPTIIAAYVGTSKDYSMGRFLDRLI